MKKKLAFLMVALVAVGAFALQTSFRAFNNATAAEDWEITAGAYSLLGNAEQSLVGQTASVTIDGNDVTLSVTASSIPVTLNGTLSGTTVTFPKGQAVMGQYYLLGSNAAQTSVTDIVFTYDATAKTLTQQTPRIVVSNSATSIGTVMGYIKDVVLQGASGGSSTSGWVKTDPADLTTGDVVVIVDQACSKAMANDNGTSSAPTAVSVTLSDDQITSTVDANLQWTVTVNTTGTAPQYQFAVGDSYLYVTKTNNGVRVGSGERNTFTIVTGGDNNGYYLYNGVTSPEADDRYVGCYSEANWRCYTSINSNIKGNNIAFFKQSGDTPPAPTANYYVVGKFGGTEYWTPVAERKMTRNTGSDTEEYMLTMNLTTADMLKVVKSSDGTSIDTWYPDGTGNAYGEHGEITADGEYTIYFRPNGDGNNDWYCNVIYVAATPISTIAEAQAADAGTTVTVEGTVVASAANGAVLYDGTDYIYYYNTSNALELYHKVRMKGALGSYGGANQFTNSAEVTDLGVVDYTDPEPVLLDGAGLNAIAAAGTVTRQFVALQGHLTISGNYYNVTVEGADGVQASLVKPKEDLSSLNDKDVVICGYAMYMTGSNYKYVYIVATIVGEPDVLEPVVWPEGVEGETWSITTTAAQTGGATQNIENEPCRVAYLADAAEAYLQAPFTLQGRQFVVTLKGSVDANKNVTIPMGQLVAQDPTQGLSAYIFAKNADQEFDDVVLTYSETAEKLSLKYEGNIYLYLTGDPGANDNPVFTLTNTEVFKELSVQSEGLYIVGNTINNWDLTNMTAMTYNEQTQAYEYVLSATETSYFAISDVDADANTVVDYNKDMREYTSFPFYVMDYTPQFSAEEGLISESPGGWYQYFIADGVEVEPGKAYTLTCEIKSAKAGNIGANMRWAWNDDGVVASTLAIEAGDWKEYSCTFAPVNGTSVGVILQPGTFDGRFCIRNVKISHVEGNWDDFNRNHRYALGQGDVDATLNEEVQLQKVNGTIVVPTGDYKISVTNDMKMTITGEAPAPDQIYLVGNTINNWDLSNMTAMTYNSLDRTFSYNLTADEKTYFAVSDVDADANTVVDYNKDMREYTSFPFYVMDYTPQFSAEEGLISESPGGWYQYFIADGVDVEPGKAYTLTCEIKSAKAGNIGANMRWAWNDDGVVASTLAIEAGDWKEYSCTFAAVNGSPVGVILQPGTFDGRFCIRNVKITHEEGNWDDFNANHRYALGEGDVDATLNEELQLQKVNGSVVLNPGEYTITIDENMKMTITGEEAPQQEKLYIIGSMNGWDRTAMTEMTIDAATGNYMYEYSPTEEAYFAFATYQQTAEEAEADPNWETFNSEYRWAIAEGDQLAELDTPYDLQKVNGTIKLPAGQYFIIVTPEMQLMITGSVTPQPDPDYYVVGESTPLGLAWGVVEANKMELQQPDGSSDDKIYVKTYENVEFTAGDVIKFKVGASTNGTDISTWYPEGMDNEYTAEISMDGTYKVTFTFNATQSTTEDPVIDINIESESNPELNGDWIFWTEDDVCAQGSAEALYGTEDFYVSLVDTDGKHAVDANNAYFGDATQQIKFTHRFKTGGKSGAKNSMTLTIPSDGKLSVYVRTGSNSETNRNLVLTQDENELYNQVVQEADAIQVAPEDLNVVNPAKADGDPVKVYPIITVDVVAGEVAVGYPTGSLNFYAFQFVSETTGIVNIMPEQQGFDESLPAYNLQGQRVTKSYRGIVIQNGRKFMNK